MIISTSGRFPASDRTLQLHVKRGQGDPLAAVFVKTGIQRVAVQVNARQAQQPAAAPQALCPHNVNPADKFHRVQPADVAGE